MAGDDLFGDNQLSDGADDDAPAEERHSFFLVRWWKDFLEFLGAGHAVTVGVAFVLGATFTAFVNAVVNDLTVPLLGAVFGQKYLTRVVIHVGHGEILIGAFFSQIMRTVVIGLTLYLILKSVEKAGRHKKKLAEEAAAKAAAEAAEQQQEEVDRAEDGNELLRQIRNALFELRDRIPVPPAEDDSSS